MKYEEYEKLRGLCIEEIEIGQEAIISKTITESDIILFSAVTGDNNPVHTSEEFAKETIFKKRVGHGFLTASLISTVIGTKLPGPGSIYLNQSLSFLAPVFIGETITIRVSVLSKDVQKAIESGLTMPSAILVDFALVAARGNGDDANDR